MYQVKVYNFSGPLDLLLQLVEKRNLKITEISLAQITQDYLDHIDGISLVSPNELADFLVIASTLLLIKSKSLLPSLEITEEEESEILNLENKLELYRFFQERGKEILEILKRKNYLYSRPLKEEAIVFLPPKNLSLDDLLFYYKKIIETIEPEIKMEERKIEKVVSLKERIKELINRLTKGKTFSFDQLIEDKNKRIELIVTFLAVLHLAKEGVVDIQQKKNFEKIWISSL
ncbi:MAG TPA: segregation/condensation protein A [Candidatus Paceibacterota bacterium]|nr:segregation/condensation protein A [Candidatus Paceibacterota bacterium]